MKRCIPLLLTLAACGAVPDQEPIAEEQQEASQSYVKTNGSVAMSNGPTRFCHLTYLGAQAGNSGSGFWPNGFAKIGARWTAFDPLYAQAQGFGTATAKATCDDFSNFGFGPQASQSGPGDYYRLWGVGSGENTVSDTVNMWAAPQSFCFINGADSLYKPFGQPWTESIVVRPNWPTNNWQMDIVGTPTFGAYAKCIFPNRTWTLDYPYIADPGAPATGPLVQNGSTKTFCALTSLWGNLDSGYAQILKVGSGNTARWVLDVGTASGSSNTVHAEMACAVF